MTRKVCSFKKFLEIVGQADRIKLDNFAFKLLNTAGVDVSMDVVISMKEIEPKHDRVRNVKYLVYRKVLSAERFPV